MSIKSILAVFFITALSICGLTYYSSTSAKHNSGFINPAYKEYIAAYTAGYVSVESKILIVLQEETTLEIEEGKDASSVTIDDFELLKLIGKGGYSQVFMARKKDSG